MTMAKFLAYSIAMTLKTLGIGLEVTLIKGDNERKKRRFNCAGRQAYGNASPINGANFRYGMPLAWVWVGV
jgi:hypothetical protein